jgi:hypothetical protein
MSKKKFKITKDEGIRFSKISGDYNKIHIEEIFGYNSIFGSIICHGALVILKFLKKINLKKKKLLNINVKFYKPLFYNSYIFFVLNLKNKNETKYVLKQDNEIKADISLRFKIGNYGNYTVHRDLFKILSSLSKYVGMTYPGKNSLINSIDINYISKKNFGKKIKIKSQLTDKRFFLIKNKLVFKNYNVFFESMKRPFVIDKKIKLKKSFEKKIKVIKDNVLILGASQGIGKDVFNIMKKNKKIIKIITYYKNVIKSFAGRNTIVKKIDIRKDFSKIKRIIDKYSPLRLYYFPTTKISFRHRVNKKIVKEYKNFYINYPLRILKENKSKKISFFYPSTKNIDYDKGSIYSKIKQKAEIKINTFCLKNKIPIYIHRYPAINSRQSLTLLNQNLPNLLEYLEKNKKAVNKIFPNPQKNY